MTQHVWGLTYVDELVQVGHNDDPADTEQLCESFYWSCQDANYNVLGLVDSEGVLVERYEYTPYGQRTVFFSPGLNDPGCNASTSISRRRTYAGENQPWGLCAFGHQGLMHEREAGNIYNRARMLSPDLERDRGRGASQRGRAVLDRARSLVTTPPAKCGVLATPGVGKIHQTARLSERVSLNHRRRIPGQPAALSTRIFS